MSKFKHGWQLWGTMLLSVVIGGTLCAPAFADYEMTVSLEKAGEIPEEVLTYDTVNIYPQGLITEDSDGHFYVLDEMGVNHLGRSYDNASYFTNDYFMVYDARTWPNSCGLVKSDGTVVLPCESAIINGIRDTDRYLKITVATEPTDKENAVLYTYDGWVAYPDEDSEYYDGYVQYYDLKEGAYFEDWNEADPADIRKEYSAEPGADHSSWIILDPDGEQVAELASQCYEIYGEGEVFSIKTDDGNIIVDRNDVPISDIAFKTSPTETNGFLWGVSTKDQDYKTVMDFSGNVYADAADEIKNVVIKPYGLTLLYNGDGHSLLLYPDGTAAELGDYDGGGDLPYYIEGKEDDPNQLFVLNEGQYKKIEEENITTSGMDGNLMLLARAEGESDYSLYSAADGSILLENGGSRILASDNWVYALKDGIWTIYKVSVNY